MAGPPRDRSDMLTLVVGATGMLGREICRQLRENGHPVRALVRKGSEGEEFVRGLGAEIVRGDLKNSASLRAACDGAGAVVSTANSMLRRRRGDSIWSVDRDGHLSLIAAATEAGVPRFVFVSVHPESSERAPFIRCKRRVEAELRRSGLAWTILQAGPFMEVWFSPRAGWDLDRGRVTRFGPGTRPRSFISLVDVAQYAVLALEPPILERRDVVLGGPEVMTDRDVVRVFEEVTGRRLVVRTLPIVVPRVMGVVLRPFHPCLSSLMRMIADGAARGETLDMAPALALARPPRPLTSVRDFARRLTAADGSSSQRESIGLDGLGPGDETRRLP